MIDSAFYNVRTGLTVEDIVQATGARMRAGGDAETVVSSVASMSTAGEGDLTFCESDKSSDPQALESGICVCPPGLEDRFGDAVCVLLHNNPRWVFSVGASLLASPRDDWAQTGFVHESAKIGSNVKLGPGAVISPDVQIGDGSHVMPGAFIGSGVTIGKGAVIGANSSVRFARIGDNVTIGAGSIIGETGFGLSVGPQGMTDTPHFGRVIIQDNVSLGSSVCVDRGLLEDTVIGQNVKIDNLCQIAHNVKIGANVVVAAFCGFAGSSTIGENVMFGGRSGVADHKMVGAGAKLGAGSATMNDIPPGETWGGYPAKPIKSWMREVAWVARESQKRKKPE